MYQICRNDTDERIIKLVKESGGEGIGIKEVQANLKISLTSTQKHLHQLALQGAIKQRLELEIISLTSIFEDRRHLAKHWVLRYYV